MSLAGLMLLAACAAGCSSDPADVPDVETPRVVEETPALGTTNEVTQSPEAEGEAVKRQAQQDLFEGIIDTDGTKVAAAIKAGADVNAAGPDGDPPLFMATYRGDRNIVEAILRAGATINAKSTTNMTALDDAIAQGHTKLTRFLKSKGATATGRGQELQNQSPYTNNDHWDNPSPVQGRKR